MRASGKYLVAVALLAVLAVVFGLAGTVAPVSELVSPEESSSSDSFTRFASTQATHDSGWVDITDKAGQYVPLTYGLNTTDVVIDITGKQSLDPEGGALAWSRTKGGANSDYAYSVVQMVEGGYAWAGYTNSFGAGGFDFWLVKTDSAGNLQWNKTYGGASSDSANSVVQTFDGGYALAGHTNSFGAGASDFWLVKTDANGNMVWNQTYGGTDSDLGKSVIQTFDGGYAIAGRTSSFGAGGQDFWLVKADSAGNMQWNQTYGGANDDYAYSVVQTGDGGYAIAGHTFSFGAGGVDFWLVKTEVETGLAWTGLTNYDIILYRGINDLYWNYVRVRIWLIKEPTWMYGDINQDGVVDAQDLFIVGQNYGKTFSLLSLSGIVAVAGLHTYKKRKQPK